MKLMNKHRETKPSASLGKRLSSTLPAALRVLESPAFDPPEPEMPDKFGGLIGNLSPKSASIRRSSAAQNRSLSPPKPHRPKAPAGTVLTRAIARLGPFPSDSDYPRFELRPAYLVEYEAAHKNLTDPQMTLGSERQTPYVGPSTLRRTVLE